MSETHTEKRSLAEIRQMESRTDWERLRQMTDDEIEAAAREDPDSPLLDDEWLRAARLVAPSGAKEQISIRLNEEVVAFFRSQGRGYQTRINDVLKAYVLTQRLKAQRDALEEDEPSKATANESTVKRGDTMSKGRDRTVYQRDDGKWVNKRHDKSKASSVHGTQKAAQQSARKNLQNQGGGELITKGRDGKIRSKDTIAPGNDPNPPKDKEH
jgi:uncharacterized protein (DUF4415 family)